MDSRYDFFQNKLGVGARLAIKLYILDAKGVVIQEDGYNELVSMPMTSVKKVAIALCTLKKVFLKVGRLLKSKMKIFLPALHGMFWIDIFFCPGTKKPVYQ